MPIDKVVSVQTFQNLDGSNFSTEGVDARINVGNGSLSTYIGIGTNFTEKSTGLVADVKGSLPYGNSPISGGFRVRHNLNAGSKTVQVRVQPSTVTVPVGKGKNWYTTPYVASKYNYQTQDLNTNLGVFSGLSFKVGKNTKCFVEGQLYDVTKINNSTMGINAGISIPL